MERMILFARWWQVVLVLLFAFNVVLALINAASDQPLGAVFSALAALALAFSTQSLDRTLRRTMPISIVSWQSGPRVLMGKAALRDLMNHGVCPDCTKRELIRFESGAYGCGNPQCRSLFTANFGRLN